MKLSESMAWLLVEFPRFTVLGDFSLLFLGLGSKVAWELSRLFSVGVQSRNRDGDGIGGTLR